MSEDTVAPAELERSDIERFSDERFTGDNVAIVTGGASGIGRATAIVLAENGVTTVATDVDEDGLEGTVEKGEELGVEGEIHALPGDLTDDAEMAAVVEEAAELGDIRFLANIAGIQHIDAIEDFPMDTYDVMHQVMLRGPLYLSKLCLPHMEEAGGGVIGNMASVHGHYVTRDKVAYNMMKFGIRGLTRSIAAEGEGQNRSFSISTGYVKTPLVMNQIEDTAESRGITEREVVEDVMLGQARTKEMMEPVEVGNLFAFGFSQNARHLNGNDLLWDGGYTHTYE
ncbi:D-beta-hydroxybutyrate dehydrogenase [Halobiforma lacisalsi AJ5]|uniref:D-beta-hydroxybutyrate dehydrogenase n=1 Tax=Natronobacterium lacisalsi AJ5 TaxID=358396 RepID=M0L4Y6_NATLA|nr:SDR family oxidoreductase [Halobiforma lacisalsi]APW98070.1 D-beta-hydroxybutyrate dehydrogenase [Halobiforma lacisalsi AJ5]EMA28626.1 short-chain dehydrogenase/reductase SDR [Halobiforma lacisalsi AJ5]